MMKIFLVFSLCLSFSAFSQSSHVQLKAGEILSISCPARTTVDILSSNSVSTSVRCATVCRLEVRKFDDFTCARGVRYNLFQSVPHYTGQFDSYCSPQQALQKLNEVEMNLLENRTCDKVNRVGW